MTTRNETASAVTSEAAKSTPATVSERALPIVNGTGPGEWNNVLLRDVLQVCSGGNLGDKGALEKARVGIAAMRGMVAAA